jgi:hypothetical protein
MKCLEGAKPGAAGSRDLTSKKDVLACFFGLLEVQLIKINGRRIHGENWRRWQADGKKHERYCGPKKRNGRKRGRAWGGKKKEPLVATPSPANSVSSHQMCDP